MLKKFHICSRIEIKDTMESNEIYSNSENIFSPDNIFMILVVISQAIGTAMVRITFYLNH